MPIVNVSESGFRMHYTERGSGTPVVLLMGLGAEGSLWEPHVQAYEKHFRCILVDNRGAGNTDKPDGPYTTKQMARDTLDLMEALGLAKVHVGGISMGSAIAQELALMAPDRLLSLTLNCPWKECDAYTQRIFETFRSAYARFSPSDFQKLLQLFIFTSGYHKGKLPDLLARQRAAEDSESPMPTHAFQAQCDACITHRTTGRLGQLSLPVLITVGDHDLFTPPDLSQAIAAELTHAELAVFQGSGHTHHWDQLERFNWTTLDFMRRQEELA